MPVPRDRDHTIFQLDEVIEELHITHSYHHLNYAWNSRRFGPKRAMAAHDKDLYRLRQMPKDIDLGP